MQQNLPSSAPTRSHVPPHVHSLASVHVRSDRGTSNTQMPPSRVEASTAASSCGSPASEAMASAAPSAPASRAASAAASWVFPPPSRVASGVASAPVAASERAPLSALVPPSAGVVASTELASRVGSGPGGGRLDCVGAAVGSVEGGSPASVAPSSLQATIATGADAESARTIQDKAMWRTVDSVTNEGPGT